MEKSNLLSKETENVQEIAGAALSGGCENGGDGGQVDHEAFQRMSLILFRLGITINYAGFNYMACAVSLCIQEPDRLLLVTKWLYPDIARRYHTSPECVERNIRTICRISWERNPDFLCEMAKRSLAERPSNTEMIAILTTYLSFDDGLGEG